MIEALYEIGKVQEAGDFLNEFIEDIGDGYKHVFKIIFDITDPANFAYKEIGYEEFDKGRKLKYLYKKGAPNGPDRTPTSKITNLTKTFNKKILTSVRTFIKDNGKVLDETGRNFLANLDECLNVRKDDILKDLISLTGQSMQVLNLEKDSINDGGVLTMVFANNGRMFYLGDMDIFKNAFYRQENDAFQAYYFSKTRNEECRGFDTACYICREKKAEVWGLVSTFKSYTVDKPGMVTGGFKQADAWKNYPVCPDCMLILERGKKVLEEKLNHTFCGFTYFIIPQLSLPNQSLLSGVLDRLYKLPKFSLAEKEAERIERIEERVIAELAREGNFINFNFLFFKEEQSGAVFNILMYLPEIAPTRLKQLIEAKAFVDSEEERKYKLFPEITTKNDKVINFDFKFAQIRSFFPNTKIEGNFDKDFLAIIEQIFIGRQISFDLLLRQFMGRLRVEFLNDDRPYHFTTLYAYKIVLYIERLKLLKRRIYKMGNTTQTDYLADFFNEHAIFDCDSKKAVFLEGVLAEKLLNIQYRERSSKPFRERLNGLKIDGKIARRLLPEMVNKLEEYDKNFYKELEQGIAAYMLNENFSAFSVDELSFYFTLGMSLANKVLPKNQIEDEKENINE